MVAQHHSAEDTAVFPHLRARDQGLGPVLDRLQEEHHIIHAVLDSVDRALVGFSAKSDNLTGLQDVADQLSDALLSHLAYEERELIEPLARYAFYDNERLAKPSQEGADAGCTTVAGLIAAQVRARA